MLSTLLLLISTTFAGKLADDNGFRNSTFGPSKALEENPPMEGCTKTPDKNILWYCSTNLGGHPIIVKYIQEEDLFYGVYFEGHGYNTCHSIRDILLEGWGQTELIQEKVYLEKYEWFDQPILAVYEFNDLNNLCSTYILNAILIQKVEQIQKEKAKAAVKDL